MFTAAIFDMDGLLLDSERVIMRAWCESAAEAGMDLSQADFIKVVGASASESRTRLSQMLGGGKQFEAVRSRAQSRLLAQSALGFPLKPGALRLLSLLQERRIPCAVASSTGVSEVRRRLAKAGMLDFFKAIAGGDEVRDAKPDPAVYLLAAERLGVAPAQCLAFEDTDHGARAAHAAGIPVIVIPDLRAHDFSAAFMHLASLEHAFEHLDRWF